MFLVQCVVFQKNLVSVESEFISIASMSIMFSHLYHTVALCEVSKYGVLCGPYFPALGLNNTERCGVYLSIFSPNVGKYGPGKTPYFDTFYALQLYDKFCWKVNEY